jgi:hypothetical protein
MSYSQIVAEKKENPVVIESKPKPRKQMIREPEPVFEEEEEEEEEVNLNPSYEDFADDQSTVILPESTNVFFGDDLQFGSLSLNEKEVKSGQTDSYGWDTRQPQQTQQFEKKKQHHQKFVPNQPFYGNPYMNPYMNPNMYNPYFKNPYQQQGGHHVEQVQPQKGENFEGHDMQGFNPYGGMPFGMYNPYTTPQYVQQPHVKKDKQQQHHDGEQKGWGGKSFGN